MKKKVIAALALAALIISGLAALALGGSSGDPLISLSYLSGTFLSKITADAEDRADASAAADYQAAQDSLDAANTVYAARAGLFGGDWNYSDLYMRQGYKYKDVVRLASGSGFMFLEGSASAAAAAGELVDVTSGSSAAAIGSLTPGHRYLAGEDAVVSVTILSDAAYLAPQGYYSAAMSGEDALPFTDIVSTSWYYEYVRYACSTRLFNGISVTLFAPSASMTRAMLATVLFRLAGTPDTAGEAGNGFTDVPAGIWYETSVNWAAASGIVNGMGSGRYAPGSNITREQMAVMLYRYASDYAGLDVSNIGDLSAFPDAGMSSAWAKDALSWAVGEKIMGGRSNGTLDPGGLATRAEVAAMLQRFSVLL